LLPELNSTSTRQSLPLIEFNNNGLFTERNGLPNKTKHNASSIVDLPAPFEPTINVLGDLSNCISVKWLPVLNRFFHFILRNNIIQFQ
jgi:hypothetical protein